MMISNKNSTCLTYQDRIDSQSKKISFSSTAPNILLFLSHSSPLYGTFLNGCHFFLFLLSQILHNNFYSMYRHLSPKVGPKDKQEELQKLKHTITGATPVLIPQSLLRKDNQRPKKEKEPNTPTTAPIPSTPLTNPNSSAGNLNPNKRIQVRTNKSKNGSVFDDYYEKKPKVQHQKDKKQQISLSGDSYQSQGFGPIKKKPNSPKSITDKLPPNTLANKNIVTSPLANNQDRNGFKSPGNRLQNKNTSQDEKSGKRILSFGGKKLMGGRFLQDSDALNSKKNNVEPVVMNYSGSPQGHKGKYHGLDVSDQKSRKEVNKLNTSNQDKPKNGKNNKNVPKFITNNNNIKSSPYLPKKISLDSSNEFSGDKGIKKVLAQHQAKEREKQKQKLNGKDEEDKSLSFNRGQMFLSLKKRQEQHSLLCKQLNMLGIVVQLKLITNDGDKPVKLTLIKKISESKKTGIFLGYHQPTSFLYCLKRTPLSDTKKSIIEQSIQQHKIQQFCIHPHLVKSFSSAYDSQYLYLIMQFMQGETLGQQLRTELLRSMSEQQSAAKAKINQSVTTQISRINKIRKVLFQISGGVAYLHQRGLVHRDIKPDNVFISHDTYKLGDFGSAAKVGSLQYVGTLDYAAPQILAQLPYDEKVDIWSLGCIAYELDVGRPPFFHINPEQTKRLAGQYDRGLISDNQLRGLIQRMLQVNRKSRISARDLLKNEFFHDLQQRSSFF